MQTQPVIRHSGAQQAAEVFVLRHNEAEAAWPQIVPLFERIQQREIDAKELRVMLMVKEALLWGLILPDGTIEDIWVTKIMRTQSACWGLVWLAAGNSLEAGCAAFEEHTIPYFAAHGCKWAQIVGRPGWEHVLKGFRREAVVLVRDLEPCH